MALTTGQAWLAGLATIAAAVIGYETFFANGGAPGRPELPYRPKAFPETRTGGPGVYVVLFNYPAGHGDRRVKGIAGPFATVAQASAKADAEKNVWYPKVMRGSSLADVESRADASARGGRARRRPKTRQRRRSFRN